VRQQLKSCCGLPAGLLSSVAAASGKPIKKKWKHSQRIANFVLKARLGNWSAAVKAWGKDGGMAVGSGFEFELPEFPLAAGITYSIDGEFSPHD